MTMSPMSASRCCSKYVFSRVAGAAVASMAEAERWWEDAMVEGGSG